MTALGEHQMLPPVKPSGWRKPYLIERLPDGRESWGRQVRYPSNSSHHEGWIEETWIEEPPNET